MKKRLINSLLFFVSSLCLFLVSYISEISYLVPIILLTLFIYLKYYYQRLFKQLRYNYLALGLLLTMAIVAAKALVTYSELSIYYIPLAVVSMLCTILFNDIGLSFVLTLAASLSVGIITSGNLDLTCVLFIGGIFSSILVLNLRRRSQIIKAGIFSGVIQAFSAIFINSPFF